MRRHSNHTTKKKKESNNDDKKIVNERKENVSSAFIKQETIRLHQSRFHLFTFHFTINLTRMEASVIRLTMFAIKKLQELNDMN